MKNPVQSKFDIYFKEDETLVWEGQPVSGYNNKSYIILLVILSIISFVFTLYWNFIVWVHNAPLFFKIAGFLLLIILLLRAFLHILIHSYRRSKLRYALTTQRFFIEYVFFGKHIKSYDLTVLSKPKIKFYNKGVGTILFDNNSFLYTFKYGSEYQWIAQNSRLEFIYNANEVYQLILECKAKLKM